MTLEYAVHRLKQKIVARCWWHVVLLSLLAIPMSSAPAYGIEFDSVYAGHAVLQADVAYPISGVGEPGEQMTLTFQKQVIHGTVDENGRWKLWLQPLQVSNTPDQLTVQGTISGQAVLRDVLVGHVWLCAGQSNMAFPLKNAFGGKDAAEESQSLSNVRFLQFHPNLPLNHERWTDEQRRHASPDSYFTTTNWSPANDDTCSEFSAVGFYFGRYLSYELDAPVGLIHVAVGGTPTEAWVPRQNVRNDDELMTLDSGFPFSPAAHPFVNSRAAKNFGVERGTTNMALMEHPFRPGFMYDATVRSLNGLPIAGVLWYQGESNVHDATRHRKLLQLCAAGLRTAFHTDELPVLTVQLPGLNRQSWPEFRESQVAACSDADMEIITTLDVGHPTDVHPKEKRTVGERLARLALQVVYEKPIAGRPPELDSVELEDDCVTLHFRNYGEGLRMSHAASVAAFQVAGIDRVFRPATSVQVINNVARVRCSLIEHPIAVRYCWEADPAEGMTRIDDDCPALPFRTDEWETIRIACVGDSITQGIGLTTTYPAALSQLVGPLFDVRNFGRSGTTVQTSINRAGWNRGYTLNVEHDQSLAFEPHVVILNLGINDLSPGGLDVATFEREYEELIETYAALPTSPTILLWTPLAPLFPGQRYFGSEMVTIINQAIANVARRKRVMTIDMYSPLTDHAAWFPDNLHPNDRGAAAIARHTHRVLESIGLPTSPSTEESK